MGGFRGVGCTYAYGFRPTGDDSTIGFQVPSTIVDLAGSKALGLGHRDAGASARPLGLPQCDYPDLRKACSED